ncbi:hypothetical protein [Acuticoccus kandeliae]|uniref:hypothetical protein n=1 Tax=Acuticoccus kandeliae TaxID=2073160 RepID=UPI000D3E1131|nr:hypothetical protein [Acuticoccus kandeliae]
MHLLAIDPATHMGLARWMAPDTFWSGVEVLEGATPAARLHHARDMLRRKLIAFQARGEAVDAVYCEDFRAQGWGAGASNAGTVEFLTMLKGIILEVGEATKTPVVLVVASTWRKSYLGTGKMSGGRAAWKKAVKEQCARLGIQVSGDDEAEAVGLLCHARSVNDPRFAVRVTPLFARSAA